MANFCRRFIGVHSCYKRFIKVRTFSGGFVRVYWELIKVLPSWSCGLGALVRAYRRFERGFRKVL